MKGLLLKEFYIWLKTRSWIMLYILIISVLTSSTGKGTVTPFLGIGILIGTMSSSFLQDEKSRWQNYTKTLPCTPFERVSAKYIIHFSEFLIGVLAFSVSNILAQNKFYTEFDIYVSPGNSQLFAEIALLIAEFILFFAIKLPFCFKFKGTLRTIFSFIPMLIVIAVYAFTVSASLSENMTVLSVNIYIPVLMIITSLVFLAASLMISVVIESDSQSKYKKKFTEIAVILIAVAVAISAATAVLSYNAHKTISTDTSGTYEEISDKELVTEEINNYYSLFCNELHFGMPFDELADELLNAGFIRDNNRKDFFVSESGNISVDLGVSYPDGEKISNISATCKNATKTFRTADYDTFKNIYLCFSKGMTVAELHQKFEELELIPCEIEEQIFSGTEKTRRYSFEFITPDFENEEKGVEYSVRIDTDGETVTNVTDLMLFIRDKTPVATAPSETPAETAAREMKDYADNFCGEVNIIKTPREFIKELKTAGFSESETKFDYYYSPERKVSVSIETDEEDKLSKITVFAHFGKTRNTDSAEKLDEFASVFTVGTDEKILIEKLEEMNALPDSITEDFTDSSEPRRSYEIKYNVEGNVACSVTIDTVNGKVTDVLVF